MTQRKIPLLKDVLAEADTLRAAVYDAEMVEAESARVREEITGMVKAAGLAQLLAGSAQTAEALPTANAEAVASALARASAARGEVMEALYLAGCRAVDGSQFDAAARVFAALKTGAGNYRNAEALRGFALAMRETLALTANNALPAARAAADKAFAMATSQSQQKQARAAQRELYVPQAMRMKQQGAYAEAIKTLDEWLRIAGADEEAAKLRDECQRAHFEVLRGQMAEQIDKLIVNKQFDAASAQLIQWVKSRGEDEVTEKLALDIESEAQKDFEQQRDVMVDLVNHLASSKQFDKAILQLKDWWKTHPQDSVTLELDKRIEEQRLAEIAAKRHEMKVQVAQHLRDKNPDLAFDAIQAWMKIYGSDAETEKLLKLIEDRKQQIIEEERVRLEQTLKNGIRLSDSIKIEFIKIPAGKFLYGDTQEIIQLPEYWMARTPVTEAQFAAFAKSSEHLGNSETARCIKNARNHPMTHVNCADAEAFCQWLSKLSGLKIRLPNEREWEKAARGTEGWNYPWGNEEPSKKTCNISGIGPGTTTSVGSYPAGNSPYGCEDMVGNVWEWTSSSEGSGRVLRGGSWNLNASRARCAYRNNGNPDYRLNYGGFRVCASPI